MGENERYRSVFQPTLFDGEVHIVTGGGSGIGRCTAHELASLGAKVILIGRKQEKLEEVAAEIAADGERPGLPLLTFATRRLSRRLSPGLSHSMAVFMGSSTMRAVSSPHP